MVVIFLPGTQQTTEDVRRLLERHKVKYVELGAEDFKERYKDIFRPAIIINGQFHEGFSAIERALLFELRF